jgi:hypothetical protein
MIDKPTTHFHLSNGEVIILLKEHLVNLGEHTTGTQVIDVSSKIEAAFIITDNKVFIKNEHILYFIEKPGLIK